MFKKKKNPWILTWYLFNFSNMNLTVCLYFWREIAYNHTSKNLAIAFLCIITDGKSSHRCQLNSQVILCVSFYETKWKQHYSFRISYLNLRKFARFVILSKQDLGLDKSTHFQLHQKVKYQENINQELILHVTRLGMESDPTNLPSHHMSILIYLLISFV